MVRLAAHFDLVQISVVARSSSCMCCVQFLILFAKTPLQYQKTESLRCEFYLKRDKRRRRTADYARVHGLEDTTSIQYIYRKRCMSEYTRGVCDYG